MLAKRAKRSIRVTVTPISRRRGHSGPPPMPIDGRYASSFGFNHPTIRSRRSVIGKLRWCCKLKQASTEYLYMKCNVESLQDVPLDPLQLGVAARLAYPDGSMTASGLRKEAGRGRLAIERVAGKDYTTLSAIAEMRREMPPRAKGVRLWLRPERRSASGKLISRASWISSATGDVICFPGSRRFSEKFSI